VVAPERAPKGDHDGLSSALTTAPNAPTIWLAIVEDFSLGHVTLRVSRGDIAALPERVDVLVSPDDNLLSHDGGASQALWAAAGEEQLEDWAAGVGGLRLADVECSPAFALKAEHLAHVVTVDFDQGSTIDIDSIGPALRNILSASAAVGARSLALPMIGAGVAGLSGSVLAAALVRELGLAVLIPERPPEVQVVVFAEDDLTIVEELRKALEEQGSFAVEVERVTRDGRQAEIRGAFGRLLAEGLPAAPALLQAVLLSLRACPVLGSDAPEGAESVVGSLGEMVARLQSDPRVANAQAEVLALSAAVAARNALVNGRVSGDVARQHGAVMLEGCRSGLRLLGALVEGEVPDAVPAVRRPDRAVPPGVFGVVAAPLIGHLLGVGPLGLGVVAATAVAARARDRRRRGDEKGRLDAANDAGSRGRASPKPAARPVTEPLGATTHVRSLQQLIDRLHDEEGLRALDARLAEQGYTGDPALRRLEFCVRMDDPVEYLSEHFLPRTLREELRQRTGEAPDTGLSTAEVARRLVESLGFPARRAARGLSWVKKTVMRLESRLVIADGADVRGLVVEAGAALEHAVHILLRFLCKVYFGESADEHFHRNGRLEHDRLVSKCSFGILLELLEELSREIGEARKATGFGARSDLMGMDRQLAPPAAREIVPLRNAFAHAREERALPPETLETLARDFFRRARAFIEHLEAEGGGFPRVITVTEIRVDRWNRRTVVARDEDDQVERLFTDALLTPGRVYYMHPLTNPLRVDPILVEAGSP